MRNSLTKLQFRNTLLVYVKADKKNLFDDQCLYINSKNIKSGRVKNFNKWGQNQNNAFTILCFEYWFHHKDEIWGKKRYGIYSKISKSRLRNFRFFRKK